MGPNNKLTPNFTFAEMTTTNHKQYREPNMQAAQAPKIIKNLTEVCKLLEVIRKEWGPVKVHSGFRCGALNAKVRGSTKSQHIKGEAADFSVGAPLEDVFKWIVNSGIQYGQLILEGRDGEDFTWIHISLGAPWRQASLCQQALIYNGVTYSQYEPGMLD
jgi:hypothetical protein